MPNPPTPKKCSRCGAALSDEQARTDSCPACLLGLGLDDNAREDAATTQATSQPDQQTIGPYRLLHSLGKGGMGEVFLAEQLEPIKRRVALKVIKPGMDTKEVVSRFEIERQALALMDHPAIATVFEAGETPAGRPYFVMEYVDGEPITTYCDKHNLRIGERLDLFVKVCEGVQHAHQKGVIHRDLKPSNVLVAHRDGHAIPKIIDFGVAKATEKLTAQTMVTDLGLIVGTPEYMSPEQASMSALGVDTRTDVYALGVILYELLTGVLPFDVQELRQIGLEEIRRTIREEEPSRPSMRLATLGDRSTDSAKRRRVDLSTLTREIRGDLDWIAMKALEKDRDRRYGSPSELAQDLCRHLSDEPVIARPPGVAYLTRRFIKRHRLATAFAATVLALLVGSSIWLSLLYRGAQTNLIRALGAESESQHVSDFLIRVFEVSHPAEARGNSVTARELLDQAAERITTELADEPGLQAKMMTTMGKVYSGLGLYERSAELLEESLTLVRDHGDERSAETAVAMTDLASVLFELGRYDESEQMLLEALEIQDEVLPPVDLRIADTTESLATVYWQRGQYDLALAPLTRCFEIREQILDPDTQEMAQILNNMGNLQMARGDLEAAEPWFLRSVDIRQRVLGPDHPALGIGLNNLAELYRRQGRLEESEQRFLESLAVKERAEGPDHPSTAYTLNNMGLLYMRQERPDDAVRSLERALRIREAALPADHPLISATMDNLGRAYHAQESWDNAEAVYLRALTLVEAADGKDGGSYANLVNNYGLLLSATERYDEAEPRMQEALEIWTRIRKPGHYQIGVGHHNLAGLFAKTGREREAEAFYRTAIEILDGALGEDHRRSVSARDALDELLTRR